MDLLSALPEDVFNEIVSYLKPIDLLSSSLVSKTWYQIIGQSNECMQKITLKYNDYECKTNDHLIALLNSDRKYQKFNIRFRYNYSKNSQIEENVQEILKKFSSSLVKLDTLNDFHRICELPKLKELRFVDLSTSFNWGCPNYLCTSGFIATCLNITRLDIRCNSLNVNNLGILQNAIQNMRNLKELALDHSIFLKDIQLDKCNFKLEKFESGTYTSIAGISGFLKHHQLTLKSIKVMHLHPTDIAFIFTEFPKLNELNFYIGNNSRENWEVPDNFTIKNLVVTGSYYDELTQKRIAKIFTKLKAVQRIKVYEIYRSYIGEFLACKSLKLVTYDEFDEKLTADQKDYINNNEKIKFVKA